MRCCVQGFTPRHTQLRRYKSSGAPSLDKPHRNPLMRWSEQLHHGWPIIHHLPQIFVGLEGCASAFNAMNAVRTCMYFGTASPPCFLTLRGPEDIQHLHPRSYSPCNDNDDGVNGTHSNKRTTIISSVARFGEDIFLNDPKSKHMPLLALENYTVRSKSLLACRFPDSGRLIIGHENRGVHRKYIGEHRTVSSKESGFAAEHVLYVPQYGTISSLNVVTSMGIALFYALMDTHFPQSRQVLSQPQSDSLSFTFNEDMDEVRNYQNLFQRSLPMVSSGSDTSRVDPRPIHPMYYQMNYEDIIQRHRRLRERLLQIEASGASRNDPALFGLSVLYQNAVDQRSLGGILRSANAFLVDAVYYFGRRKVNATGTIGTQHYTPPIYLGPHGHGALERQLNLNGAPSPWWFLDCGHAFIYSETSCFNGSMDLEDKETISQCMESLLWYTTHRSKENFTLSLCDPDNVLRGAAKAGVVLVVPQEGILPPPHILQHCERILTVMPEKHRTERCDAGLPVAVATGIALQRLSAVMHPRIAALSVACGSSDK